MWRGKVELISAVNSCFGLVEGEVVFAKAIIKVEESSRHNVAMFRGKCKTNIVNDSGANGFRVLLAMFLEYESEGDNKQERAERVALRNSFFQSVADGIVNGEGREGVGGKMNAGSIVVKKAEP
jgi:hypothetical protein